MLKRVYSVLKVEHTINDGLSYYMHPTSYESLADATKAFQNIVMEICLENNLTDEEYDDSMKTRRLFEYSDDIDYEVNVQILETDVEYGEYFPVNVEVSRDDLRDRGYDADKVSRDEMYMLASRMGHMYLDGDYFIDLEFAAEYLCLPKKENN